MSTQERQHALDAVRAFALLLGIAFHAAISFIPGLPIGIWAAVDSSPSATLNVAAFITHIFRMSLFFFIAGFFARLLLERRGVRGFWSNRLKRILVPLIVGWLILFPAILAVWGWGISRELNGAPMPAPPELPPGGFPLTHLWFLYYLLLLYVIVLAGRRVVTMLDRSGRVRALADRVLHASVDRYWGALVLGLPLAACLYTREGWVYWQGIPTPDMSLIPQLAATIGFGTAMTVGWLVHRQSTLLETLRERRTGHLIIALIPTAVCAWIVSDANLLTPGAAGPVKLIFALCFAAALWGWVFAITGFALHHLSNESPVRRYVADSSYWLYLVHLPIVAAFQVIVAPWNLHWSLKYPLVVAASLAVLFVSYHFLVRSTFVGALLNGRKYPRKKPRAPVTPEPPRPSSTDENVAELRGAVKRYGTTVALDKVDLHVKRGELLAVLGPNGAGKTTAIALWLGLIQPDEGSAWLMGGSPLEIDRRRKVGVMMQEVELTREMRVRELLDLTASYYPNPMTAEQAMALTRITPLANRNYTKLSGGQKRQVQFALAVCGKPELLFLDEPTVGLDVQARAAMWATIRKLLASGCSIVLTTHYLEEAEALADRVVVLAKSRVIACGSVADMRALVARKQISCECNVTVEEIRGWTEVSAVARDGDRLLITATDAEAVVRRLLAADERLRNLEVRQAGLTEAFEELTKEAA